jgi:prepilin-type N-terminal cleavage/methylation domain-containing protein
MARPLRSADGFTLIELLTVLVILVATVAVTVPYASRSNEGLLLERECRNIAQTLTYAVNRAAETRRPVRLTVDISNKCCLLETTADSSGDAYVPVEDGQRMAFTLSPKTQVVDLQGFEPTGRSCYSLVWSPFSTWPTASLSLAIGDGVWRIVIDGKRTSVEALPN